MKKWWKRKVCEWFHQKDHVCWDDLFKESDVVLPGKCVWFCNMCKRSWTTINPVVFQTDCADERGLLPEKYHPEPAFELRVRKCKCWEKPKSTQATPKAKKKRKKKETKNA